LNIEQSREVTVMQQRIRQRQVWRYVSLALVFMLTLAAPAGAIVKELSNDSFSGIGSVSCQVGFVEAESAAVKLTADPGDYPYQILKVRMHICPASTSGNIVLRLSEDNTGTVLPGPVLYQEIVQITGSDDALNEINLSANNIIVASGSVRVELEWLQDSPPGVSNDLDGFVPNSNYIYAWIDPPGFWSWFYANQLGVTGDWIIRMEIETSAEPPIFVDGFESGDTTEWSATSP
jgi:hypothetical protein